MSKTLIIGSRKSSLALRQTCLVRERLEAAGIQVEIRTMDTFGDVYRDIPLPKLGEKGVFTIELDTALLGGRIDLAVHSLKDLPTLLPEGLELAAVADRVSAFDVLVAREKQVDTIGKLRQDARVGTSSRRRSAQLLAMRPDLQLVDVRGNVPTRIDKMDQNGLDGLVLAEAGLIRLGLADRIAFRFSIDQMIPAVGQGALGIVTARDTRAHDVVARVLEDSGLRPLVAAERAFLRHLEGGCQTPVGAWARHGKDGSARLTGMVAAVDGSIVLKEELSFQPLDAKDAGFRLAEGLLQRGADRLLREARLTAS